MPARTDEPPRPGNPFQWGLLAADAEERPARHSLERLTEPGEQGFHGRFLAQLAAPTAQLSIQGETTFLADVVTGSVAVPTKGARRLDRTPSRARPPVGTDRGGLGDVGQSRTARTRRVHHRPRVRS